MATAEPNEKQLKGLYAITDEQLIKENQFSQSLEFALQGGASVIQYRDKSNNHSKRLQQAKIVCSLCDKYHAISIINDDINLAIEVNADGVHLGKNDDDISSARKKLGQNRIIGVSCYNDLERAIKSEADGANYVAFGAMFSSTTKPEAANAQLSILADAKNNLRIPICAIGGINKNNIHYLIEQGTDMTAIIGSLFSTSDIKQTAITLSAFYK